MTSKSWHLRKRLLNIIGVPLLTFILFVFECSDPQYYFWELIWCFCISIVLWEGNSLLIKILNIHVPWRSKATPRLIIQFGLSILLTLWVTYFSVMLLYNWLYEAHFSSLAFRKNLFLFLIISLLYNAIFTGTHFFRQWRKSIIEAEELKRQNLISQYESLKDQINPHFLFNSLNTLIGLIDEDPNLAKEYGHLFSRIYRYILERGRNETVALQEEIEIVEIHRKLLKSRFGNKIDIKIDIDPTTQNAFVPPLTLQMLVENAVKHNAFTTANPLLVQIKSTHDQRLRIENNMVPKNFRQQSTGIGLENIKKRYQFLTDRKVEVEQNEKFIVTIPLILKTKLSESNHY
jgi:sensor histidine kinase YesM